MSRPLTKVQQFDIEHRRRAEAQLDADLSALVRDDRARRVFAWLLFDRCGVLSMSFDPSKKHELEQLTEFYEGKRSIGVELQDALRRAEPGFHRVLVDEYLHQADADRAARIAAMVEDARSQATTTDGDQG
jgi:hypothetical protein